MLRGDDGDGSVLLSWIERLMDCIASGGVFCE